MGRFRFGGTAASPSEAKIEPKEKTMLRQEDLLDPSSGKDYFSGRIRQNHHHAIASQSQCPAEFHFKNAKRRGVA
jgi:hypothetical protein